MGIPGSCLPPSHLPPPRISDRRSLEKLKLRVEKYSPLKTSCSGCPCGVMCVLANFCPRPHDMVVDGHDIALVLNLVFGVPLLTLHWSGGLSSCSTPSEVREESTSSH